MSELRKLVIASGNPGKIREIERILAPLKIQVVSQAALSVSPAEEPHSTFVENALAKARHVSDATGLAAIADDSGICVEALMVRPVCTRPVTPVRRCRMSATMHSFWNR